MTHDPHADNVMRNWRALALFGIPTAVLVTLVLTNWHASTTRSQMAAEILYSSMIESSANPKLSQVLRDRETELGKPTDFKTGDTVCQILGSPCQTELSVRRRSTWHREVFYLLGFDYRTATVHFPPSTRSKPNERP